MATSSDSDPTTPNSEASPALSGRELEEELRRKAGRAKSVRPTDFEPLAWESSQTKVDRPEPYEVDAPENQSCLSLNGLKAGWAKLNVFEMASVAAFLIVALIGLFFFRGLVHSGDVPAKEEDTTLSSVAFPAKGSLLTVNGIDAIWREPRPGEIVRPGAYIVPVADISLGGGTGFLRVLFRDEEGKIRGDALVTKVDGGKAAGQGTYTAICSEGFVTSMKLVECQAGRLDPWTVQVYESKDYDMAIEEWTLITAFDMPANQEAKPAPSTEG